MADVISVIDSSSLMDIKSKIPIEKRSQLFQSLTSLALDGRLVVPSQVADEMERGAAPTRRDEALDWFRTVQATAVIREIDFDQLRHVMARVGDVVDHEKDTGEDEADPYVLALALMLRAKGNAVRVVTEDRHDRTKLSLTTAAGVLDITAVPLLGFIRAERLL